MACMSDTGNLDVAAIAEQSALPIAVLDRELRIVFANRAYRTAVSATEGPIDGRCVLEVFDIPPQMEESYRQKCFEAFAGQVSRTRIQPYERTEPGGQAEQRYWQATQEPLRNADGDIVLIVQRVQDVTHLVSLQQSNDVVTAELDHRVKNLVTVILATARITSASAESVGQYTDEFCNRLESMARYYNKMSANGWKGLSFRSMFEDELAQVAGRGTSRYALRGEDLILSLKATKDGGMLIHELVSNAAKHGCFSRPGGRLDVEWKIVGTELRIDWTESGLTGIRPPEKVGFGTKLLSMMPNAKIRKEYRDSGLRLEYIVPVHTAVDGVHFTESRRS